ncbi:glycosyltransferase family 9 protein [Flammeovirga aprica]|uniref:Glycosyltransferase family 9 protein n=1 Tax=Flammeovirga aprica JL-4 TaxID=694437 RepID=A0A7X9NZT1_9BACT|nr:glycosyltransferase family 9 protein [Flammeovirga aprica]NME66367.1 glycosyltransferase family 9 protein [Flammeovirga aprica JL-4]
MSKKILSLRFSAMGDVAMTAPVLKEILAQNEDLEIVMVSRPFLKPFFDDIPRLTFFGADLSNKYKDFKGLRALTKDLKQLGPFDAVADLHSVLRTFIIGGLFQLSGYKVVRIDKGRKEKKALVASGTKELKPLRATVERYADVFRKLGFNVSLSNQLPVKKEGDLSEETSKLLGDKTSPWIGIAPFAQHKGKIWGEQKAVALGKLLAEKKNAKVIFFGGPGEEAEILDNCVKELPGSISLAGKVKLKEELDIIAQLDVMVSMDSANMHMASLVGTECVSVWGATHHYAGFLGYGQSTDNIAEISVKELDCRPCSVFGNKPCLREDYACLEGVTPEMVYKKVVDAIGKA